MRYLSNKLGNICDTLARVGIPVAALPRAHVTHRTHNKRMRITNAIVRYRVSGNNYIGRKNDTELRASRWQREITLAMHFFFLSYEGEIIVRNCLHGEELLERHEAARNHLSFWIFVSLMPPLPYITLQLIISILKCTFNTLLNQFLISYSHQISDLGVKQFLFFVSF